MWPPIAHVPRPIVEISNQVLPSTRRCWHAPRESIWLAGSRVRGFAGSRVRGFAGSGVRGFGGSRARGSLTSPGPDKTMGLMIRGLLIASLVLALQAAAPGQGLSVLHLKVILTDAAGAATPVPRHVLLVSENPASATPRRVVTGLDGTVDVRLKPGNYTVE